MRLSRLSCGKQVKVTEMNDTTIRWCLTLRGNVEMGDLNPLTILSRTYFFLLAFWTNSKRFEGVTSQGPLKKSKSGSMIGSSTDRKSFKSWLLKIIRTKRKGSRVMHLLSMKNTFLNIKNRSDRFLHSIRTPIYWPSTSLLQWIVWGVCSVIFFFLFHLVLLFKSQQD